MHGRHNIRSNNICLCFLRNVNCRNKSKTSITKEHNSPKVVDEILKGKGCYTLTVYRYYFREIAFKSEIFLQNF